MLLYKLCAFDKIQRFYFNIYALSLILKQIFVFAMKANFLISKLISPLLSFKIYRRINFTFCIHISYDVLMLKISDKYAFNLNK